MPKRKVLYLVHNHPSASPGGTEVHALELYEAMRASREFEPLLVARSGPPITAAARPGRGTPLAAANHDPNQYFLYTDLTAFDPFGITSRDQSVYAAFRDLLSAYRPDIVHFQHTYLLGYDLIRQAREVLPQAPIVYTLHDFWGMCHNFRMVRPGGTLCGESSPHRCHECYPSLAADAFFRRERFIKAHLSLVDLFLAPSQFLIERYVAWGVPRDRIRYFANGRRVVERLPDPLEDRARTRLGYFGQFCREKGVDVLLRAMRLLARERPDIRLRLHGANLEREPQDFLKKVRRLLAATKATVTPAGAYDQADLPGLMANVDWVVMPSVWWENAPMVIQEAFLHGRPVICSNIGGMAEMVTDGVNGLHFPVGDAAGLARTILRAADTPGLWASLQAGAPTVTPIEEQVAGLTELYRGLIYSAALRG